MSDFVEVPEVYQVQVYDYLSVKNYVYHKDFDTYSAAEDFIKHFDFENDFGSNPIGISIVTMPKISIGNIEIGVCENDRKN